jgi:hypothetical protein
MRVKITRTASLASASKRKTVQRTIDEARKYGIGWA